MSLPKSVCEFKFRSGRGLAHPQALQSGYMARTSQMRNSDQVAIMLLVAAKVTRHWFSMNLPKNGSTHMSVSFCNIIQAQSVCNGFNIRCRTPAWQHSKLLLRRIRWTDTQAPTKNADVSARVSGRAATTGYKQYIPLHTGWARRHFSSPCHSKRYKLTPAPAARKQRAPPSRDA